MEVSFALRKKEMPLDFSEAKNTPVEVDPDEETTPKAIEN